MSETPRAGVAGPNKYDAFISHSHADKEIAVATARSLRRLTRPWYQPAPALKVVLDSQTFGASPNL